MAFEKIYLNTTPENRDRFQVEFNKEEREMFTAMQLWLLQSKDATALKQMAFYGWLTISNQRDAMTYLREKLFINDRNNRRLGLDVKTEIENKIQMKIEKIGWKM